MNHTRRFALLAALNMLALPFAANAQAALDEVMPRS